MLRMLAILLFCVSPAAFAGVTVHYSGTLKPGVEPKYVLDQAAAFARTQKWAYQSASGELTIFPDAWCEPIHLKFTGAMLAEDFVKTQYAPPTVHVAVIDLFGAIEPSFAALEIFDEGEYWQSRDIAKLKANSRPSSSWRSRPESRSPISSARPSCRTAGSLICIRRVPCSPLLLRHRRDLLELVRCAFAGT
jgi:hypothetical protein